MTERCVDKDPLHYLKRVRKKISMNGINYKKKGLEDLAKEGESPSPILYERKKIARLILSQ